MADVTCWVDVVGWEGTYEVSSYGDVRSLPRQVCRRNGTTITAAARTLKPEVCAKGYRRVKLRAPGLCRAVFVHVLVLEAFVGPCPAGMEARHLSGDPGNNRLSALAWGTQDENMDDRIRMQRGTLAPDVVDGVLRDLADGLNSGEIQRKRGVSRSHVCRIRRGKVRHIARRVVLLDLVDGRLVERAP